MPALDRSGDGLPARPRDGRYSRGAPTDGWRDQRPVRAAQRNTSATTFGTFGIEVRCTHGAETGGRSGGRMRIDESYDTPVSDELGLSGSSRTLTEASFFFPSCCEPFSNRPRPIAIENTGRALV